MLAARPSPHHPSARGPDGGPSHRRRGVHAGLAAIIAVMVMAVAAPAASAAPWSCDAFGYLFQTPDATTHDIVRLDLATGAYDPDFGDTPEAVNAVGYNVLDNFMYGMQGVPDVTGNVWQIVRIHDDGSVDELGLPAPMTSAIGYPIGDVDPNGHLWVAGPIPGQTLQWYEVDVTGPTPTVVDSGTVPLLPTMSTVPADWAWVNGAFYGVAQGNPAATQPARLVSFSPGATQWTDHGPLAGVRSDVYGAVFVDAAGYLYASRNADGFIYRIDPVTRQVIFVADGPESGGNDGARCAAAPVPTITVSKTVDGRVRPADQFTVGLVKPDGTAATSATTSGTATTVSTTNFPASQGQTYTITDRMAAGSPTPLSEYAKSITCTDADGNAVAAGGSGPNWTLTVAGATYYTCNVTNRAVADLVLVKSASPTPVVPGEDVTFSLEVTNNGPSTSIGETITDDLPDAVTFSSASEGCSEADGTVTCAVGTLAPGASRTFTVTGRVASDLDRCLENTGTVTGRFDPDASDNTSEICTPIEGRSNLSLAKDPSSPTVSAGGQVMYTLVVRNSGPSDDPTVEVTDALPAGLTLVSAQPSQGSCSTANNTVSCDLGRLRDGGSAQVLVTANTTTTPQCITNTASVRGAHEDPNADNNRDSARICLEPPPPARFDLEVEKRASDRGVVIGEPVRYRIVVTNNGPDAAPNARVTDTLNAPATVVSVRTTAGSCTRRIPIRCELGTIAAGDSVTVTITVKHREAGRRQRNAASATGTGVDTTPDNNMDTVDVRVRKVKLRLSKVANSATVSAGGTVGYRIRVRNPTRGVARRVRVCDRLPSGMRFVSSTPKAKRRGGQRCWTIKRLGARKSRTFRVTVRVAPGANGRKVNRATATGAGVRGAQARSPIRVRGVATPVTG